MLGLMPSYRLQPTNEGPINNQPCPQEVGERATRGQDMAIYCELFQGSLWTTDDP